MKAVGREWVKVETGLPEPYQSVLIWHFDVPNFVGPIIAFWDGKKWGADTARGDDFKVSHWMPLPEPPR